MQIPFADAVLSRLGRREAGLELIEEIEDEPQVLNAEELRKLRYILNFARLADFEPAAARGAGSDHRAADGARRDGRSGGRPGRPTASAPRAARK